MYHREDYENSIMAGLSVVQQQIKKIENIYIENLFEILTDKELKELDTKLFKLTTLFTHIISLNDLEN